MYKVLEVREHNELERYKGDYALLIKGDKFEVIEPEIVEPHPTGNANLWPIVETHTIVNLITSDKEKNIGNVPTYIDTTNVYYGSES